MLRVHKLMGLPNQRLELTGPVYRALNSTREQLFPSLQPQWSFSIDNKGYTTIGKDKKRLQHWSIFSHRAGGQLFQPELDVTFALDLEDSESCSKIFVFNDDRVSAADGGSREFAHFRCHYHKGKMTSAYIRVEDLCKPSYITLDRILKYFNMPSSSDPFVNAARTKEIFEGTRLSWRSTGISHYNIYEAQLGDDDPIIVGTLDLSQSESWQLSLNDSEYYDDREMFRKIIIHAFSLSCKLRCR